LRSRRVLGEGQLTSSPPVRGFGGGLQSPPIGVRSGVPTAQRFSCILRSPGGLICYVESHIDEDLSLIFGLVFRVAPCYSKSSVYAYYAASHALMRPMVTDGIAWSVCLCVCLSHESCKAAELIEMPFGWVIRVSPRNHLLNGVNIG